MRRLFSTLVIPSLLLYGGRAKDAPPAPQQGIEIHAPGVDIEINKQEGANVKAPGTEVHADKENGLDVKARGVELEAQPRESHPD
ncbi:MAG: hypothetical protein ABI619_01855 [Betaproteobacteria bacterium]